jgi:uncharacterized phiE125 gp8 family phage protein
VYGLTTITPPAEEPVTLDAAKLHCVIGDDAEDELLAGWIKAARELTETHTGKRWLDQSVRLTLADWPCDDDGTGGAIRLPVRPVTAVTKVEYYAADGTLTELAEDADWQVWLDHAPPLVAPAPYKVWPPTQTGRLGAVRVEFNAGYEDTADVPEGVRQAVLLCVGYWNGHRGDSDDPTKLAALPYTLGVPAGARALLDSLMTGAY